MYTWIKIAVSELPLHRLTGGAVKCLLALSWNMQEDYISTISYDRLRASLCLSRRTVIRAVQELVDSDLIEKINSPGAVLRVRLLRAFSVGRNNPPQADLSNPGTSFSFPDPVEAKWAAENTDSEKRRRRELNREIKQRYG